MEARDYRWVCGTRADFFAAPQVSTHRNLYFKESLRCKKEPDGELPTWSRDKMMAWPG